MSTTQLRSPNGHSFHSLLDVRTCSSKKWTMMSPQSTIIHLIDSNRKHTRCCSVRADTHQSHGDTNNSNRRAKAGRRPATSKCPNANYTNLPVVAITPFHQWLEVPQVPELQRLHKHIPHLPNVRLQHSLHRTHKNKQRVSQQHVSKAASTLHHHHNHHHHHNDN